MNRQPRLSRRMAWLPALLCVCSHFCRAADLDEAPAPPPDGPFVTNLASNDKTSGELISEPGGSGNDDWKPRRNKHHVGLSIGKARFNMPCIEGMVCRRNGRAITLHAGGEVSQRLGFELAYMSLSNLAHQGVAVKVRGVNLNLLGELPLASRVSLTGRLGTNYAWTRMDVPTPVGSTTGKARGMGLSYGVGVNWSISERWTASTDLNRHDFKFVTGRDAVDTASVSLRYRY